MHLFWCSFWIHERIVSAILAYGTCTLRTLGRFVFSDKAHFTNAPFGKLLLLGLQLQLAECVAFPQVMMYAIAAL